MDSISSNDENQLEENSMASSSLTENEEIIEEFVKEEKPMTELLEKKQELKENIIKHAKSLIDELRKKQRIIDEFVKDKKLLNEELEKKERIIEEFVKDKQSLNEELEKKQGIIEEFVKGKKSMNEELDKKREIKENIIKHVKSLTEEMGKKQGIIDEFVKDKKLLNEELEKKQGIIGTFVKREKSLTDELDKKQGTIEELQQNVKYLIDDLKKRENYDKKEIYLLNPKKMGKCIILNHTEYEMEYLSKRPGTEDVDALKKIFKGYNFDVKDYTNSRVDEIQEILKKARNEDHTAASCFVLCVLTHGSLNKKNEEFLCAYDATYPTEDLFSPFLRCESLAGKPKLFFIQACRGKNFDKGIGIPSELVDETDDYDKEPLICCSIPLHADYFIAYSTVRGYVSFRNQLKGSWFIQALCETLQERTENLDLASILTIVCYKLSYYHRSQNYDNSKQVPTILTTLTKRFVFPCNLKMQNIFGEENKSVVS